MKRKCGCTCGDLESARPGRSDSVTATAAGVDGSRDAGDHHQRAGTHTDSGTARPRLGGCALEQSRSEAPQQCNPGTLGQSRSRTLDPGAIQLRGLGSTYVQCSTAVQLPYSGAQSISRISSAPRPWSSPGPPTRPGPSRVALRLGAAGVLLAVMELFGVHDADPPGHRLRPISA